MDVITKAVVVGASATIAGNTDYGRKMSNAYSTLKYILKKKFGDKDAFVKMIEAVEAKPISVARQKALGEKVAELHVDQDPEIRQAAMAVLAHMATGNLHIQEVASSYVAQASSSSSATLNDDLTEDEKEQLRILFSTWERAEVSAVVRIQIVEEPLSIHNLAAILSSLAELSTKYWLIAKGRFADLIEYTQTHNSRFSEEVRAVITRISYNSPFNMDWKVDISAPSVAEALVTTIDGITQRRERLEKAKLENQAKVLELKEVEQKAALGNQMALIEQEKQRLELEQRRLEIVEKQLEVQKKSIEYALELAGKVIDIIHPGADIATRAMEIQAILPNLVLLQNGKGLESTRADTSKSNE